MPTTSYSRQVVTRQDLSATTRFSRGQSNKMQRGDDEAEGLGLSSIDLDPRRFFLIPASAVDELKAGIEDTMQPQRPVRSISAAFPAGLASTPDLASDLASTPDANEDGPHRASRPELPLGLQLQEFLTAANKEGKGRAVAPSESTDTLLSPASCHVPAGSSTKWSSYHGRWSHSLAPSRLAPHSWQKPSPGVWTIEEETESALEQLAEPTRKKTGPIDSPGAKARKRVRFLLPTVE